jgi:large repetitive protein
MSDALGNTTIYSYDNFGLLTQVISPEGIKQFFAYDANNNITQQKLLLEDGSFATKNFAYDVLDNPTSVSQSINPTTSTTTQLSYNANGAVASITDPLGTKTTIAYNPNQEVSNLTTTATSNGQSVTKNESRVYDANNNLISQKDSL